MIIWFVHGNMLPQVEKTPVHSQPKHVSTWSLAGPSWPVHTVVGALKEDTVRALSVVKIHLI